MRSFWGPNPFVPHEWSRTTSSSILADVAPPSTKQAFEEEAFRHRVQYLRDFKYHRQLSNFCPFFRFRLCSLTLTRLALHKPLGADLNSVIIAVKMQVRLQIDKKNMSENLCLMASTSSLWCYFSSSFCFVNFSSSLAEELRASFSAYQTLPFVFFPSRSWKLTKVFFPHSFAEKKSSHRRVLVKHSLVTHETWGEALVKSSKSS